MSREKRNDSFWLSYSDLMTSLFLLMLVLFVVCVGKMKYDNAVLEDERNRANVEKEYLKRILQLDEQFDQLNKSLALQYVEEKKMFIARDFVGVEIFNQLDDAIKPEYVKTVDAVGLALLEVVRRLYERNPDLSFQLVIEGNAAIPWQQLHDNVYDADNARMYELSYRRALALYLRWRSMGVDLRAYNTEVIIAGSGFNGNNRDEDVEENNKRFVIQIIPKVSRPKADVE